MARAGAITAVSEMDRSDGAVRSTEAQERLALSHNLYGIIRLGPKQLRGRTPVCRYFQIAHASDDREDLTGLSLRVRGLELTNHG